MSKDRGTAFVSSTQNNGTGTRSMPHVRISASRASASFSAPVDTAAITPTFFDGTYFSSAPDGSSTHNDNMGTHYLTGYSIPKWRYIYNTTLVALDLLTIIAASLDEPVAPPMGGTRPVDDHCGLRNRVLVPSFRLRIRARHRSWRIRHIQLPGAGLRLLAHQSICCTHLRTAYHG